jgi:hypothetical protein
MLDPTFRARTAHIVQFRSIGAERITDSPPQLAHRSRQFTAHDTLPYPYDPLINRSKRADQTSKLPVRSQHSVSTQRHMCQLPAVVLLFSAKVLSPHANFVRKYPDR